MVGVRDLVHEAAFQVGEFIVALGGLAVAALSGAASDGDDGDIAVVGSSGYFVGCHCALRHDRHCPEGFFGELTFGFSDVRLVGVGQGTVDLDSTLL